MSTSELKFDQLYTELLARVPELREHVEGAFGTEYDLNTESPGAYPIFEDVVLDFLFDNLALCTNDDLLKRLFDFFEIMAASTDGNITDLLRIAILESIVYRPEHYLRAKQYMGRKTIEFADLEERAQNAQGANAGTLNSARRWRPW